MAVASVESIVVSEPVECSGRSKNAISCLMIVLKDSYRTRRIYVNNLGDERLPSFLRSIGIPSLEENTQQIRQWR